MTSQETLDAAMAALHQKGITAEYYFSYGNAVVNIDGQKQTYPMRKGGDREAACGELLLLILADLLPIHKTVALKQVSEDAYQITRLNRLNGFSDVLLLNKSTLDSRQLLRLEHDIAAFAGKEPEFGQVLHIYPEGTTMTQAMREVAANEEIHLVPRCG